MNPRLRVLSLVLSAGGILAGSSLYLSLTKDRRIRQKVLSIVLAEPSKPNPQKYWLDVLENPKAGMPKDWCGALILWAYHKAGLLLNTKWIIQKGFLYTLPITHNPEPADVAYFEKNQHHALVKSINPDNTVTVINGNDIGDTIRESTVSRNQVKAFYSIANLIGK